MKINQSKKSISFTFIILVCLLFGYPNIANHSKQMNLLLESAHDSIRLTSEGLVSAMGVSGSIDLISDITSILFVIILLPAICAVIAGLIEKQNIIGAISQLKTHLGSKKYWILSGFMYLALGIISFAQTTSLDAVQSSLGISSVVGSDQLIATLFALGIVQAIITSLFLTVALLIVYWGTIYLTSDQAPLTILKETTTYEVLMIICLAVARLVMIFVLSLISILILVLSIWLSFVQYSEALDAIIYTIVTLTVISDFSLLAFIAISLASISSFGYQRVNNNLSFNQSYFRLLAAEKKDKLMLVVFNLIQTITILAGWLTFFVVVSDYSTPVILWGLILFIAVAILGLYIYSKQLNLVAKPYTANKLGIWSAFRKILFKVTMFIPFLPLYVIVYISSYVMLVIAKIYLLRLLLLLIILGVMVASYIHYYILDLAIVTSLKEGDLGYFKSFKWYFKLITVNLKPSIIILSKCLIITLMIISSGWILGIYLLFDNLLLLLILALIISIGRRYLKFNTYQYLFENFMTKTTNNVAE